MSLDEVVSYCAKRGIEVLSKRYLKRHAKLRCRCSECSHVWNPLFGNIMQGRGCPRCARKKLDTASPKLSLSEVKSMCLEKGIVCLAGKYEGRHYHLPCRCVTCSHEWAPTFGKILMGRGCPRCAHQQTSARQIKTLSELRQRITNKRIELVRDSHRVGKQRFCEFRCLACGDSWVTSVYSLIGAGTGCKKCSRKLVARALKLPLQQVDRRLRDKGVKRIGEYTASGKPMPVRFVKCGHEFKMTLNSIATGTGCPKCNRHVRVPNEEYHVFAKQHRGAALSIPRSVSYNALWKCEQGHEFLRPLATLRYLKRFCPYCFSSHGEAVARHVAEKVVGAPFLKVRLPELRGDGRYPLELDMYNPDCGIAIEHHGEQHFVPSAHWGGCEALKKIRARDRERRRGCKRLGIELIEIRSLGEMTTIEEFVRLLREVCAKVGVKPSLKPNGIKKLAEEAASLATPERIRLYDAFQVEARKRGYEVLEGKYLGSQAWHRIRCPNGHEYRAKPNKFLSGRGCTKCPRLGTNGVPVFVDGSMRFPSIRAAAKFLRVCDSSVHEAIAAGRKCRGHRVERLPT